MTARLARLEIEWINRKTPEYLNSHGRNISMPRLEQKLLTLKAEMSYKDNWKRLCLKTMSRHAHDEDYIVALLYLVDERCLPINELQPNIGLQVGHIYRQFRRSGVEIRAHTKSLGARLCEPYVPYKGVFYLDPLAGLLIAAGERRVIPAGVDIYRAPQEDAENPEDRNEVMGLIELPKHAVPVPLLNRKKRKILPFPVLGGRTITNWSP